MFKQWVLYTLSVLISNIFLYLKSDQIFIKVFITINNNIWYKNVQVIVYLSAIKTIDFLYIL